MAAAAVRAAGVPFPMVVVMITPDIGVKVQLACRQCLCCRVCAAGYTAVQPNARCFQRHLGTTADAATDQSVHV